MKNEMKEVATVDQPIEGEVMPEGSLVDLTADFVSATANVENMVWELGRILSEGFALCEFKELCAEAGIPTEGAEGGTQRKRFGAWVEDNIRAAGVDYNRTTLFKYRQLWETMSAYREQLTGLSISVLLEISTGCNEEEQVQKCIKWATGLKAAPTVAKVREHVRKVTGKAKKAVGYQPSTWAEDAMELAAQNVKALTEEANKAGFTSSKVTQTNHLSQLEAAIQHLDRILNDDAHTAFEYGQAIALLLKATEGKED